MKHIDAILAGYEREVPDGAYISCSPACECGETEHLDTCPCFEGNAKIEFTSSTCELCGDVAGSRNIVALIPRVGDYVNIEVCGCCYMFIANGDECEEEV